ncbi:MAG: hypothetical protein ACOY4I_17975 [Bacillota bacterium]
MGLKQKLIAINVITVIVMSSVLFIGFYQIRSINHEYTRLIEVKAREVALAKDTQLNVLTTGNEVVKHVAGALNKIISSVQQLSGKIGLMTESVVEMARELKEVAGVHQQHTAFIQEIAASSDTLSAMSVSMKRSVESFKV